MVTVYSERMLIDLGLGLIDCIAGGDGQNPRVTSLTVEYTGLHLAALQAVAKALRAQGIPPAAPSQNVITHT